MGCGINAKNFFESIDQQNQIQHPLPRTFTSFQIEQKPVQFQPFKAPEVNEEFYKLSGSQKLSYQRFLDVAQAKFIHVKVKELADYVFKSQLLNDRASYSTTYSFVTKPITREEYVQIQYVMHHWKIVQIYPILSLFLMIDTLHLYIVTYPELFKIFAAHFGVSENIFMRNFNISKKKMQQKATIEFKLYLKDIQQIQNLFYETNPFEVSIYSDTVLHELDNGSQQQKFSTRTRPGNLSEKTLTQCNNFDLITGLEDEETNQSSGHFVLKQLL